MTKTYRVVLWALLTAAIVVSVGDPSIASKKEKPLHSVLTNEQNVVGQPASNSQPQLNSSLSGESIEWQVISSGGTYGTSVNYSLEGTTAQTATGTGSSANYEIGQGFWYGFLTQGASYVCGDANESGTVDIDDVVWLIAYIFSGGPEPMPYLAGDANCSEGVDIDDVVYLISYIFSGGPEPCDPDDNGVSDC